MARANDARADCPDCGTSVTLPVTRVTLLQCPRCDVVAGGTPCPVDGSDMAGVAFDRATGACGGCGLVFDLLIKPDEGAGA